MPNSLPGDNWFCWSEVGNLIYKSFPDHSDKHLGMGACECCVPKGLHSSGSMSQWSLSPRTIVLWTKTSQPWLPSWYRLTYSKIAFEKQQAVTFSSKIILTNKQNSCTPKFELKFSTLIHDRFYSKKYLTFFSEKPKNYNQIVIILSFYQGSVC